MPWPISEVDPFRNPMVNQRCLLHLNFASFNEVSQFWMVILPLLASSAHFESLHSIAYIGNAVATIEYRTLTPSA